MILSMSISKNPENALNYHRSFPPGKYEIRPTKPLKNYDDLSLAYSPGVAKPCLEIKKDEYNVNIYTNKANTVGIITNGTAVLGLGNIGASASKPVMEGKAVLFKQFSNINGIDIEVDTEDVDKFINSVRFLGKTWGGINLEDIRAPDCFIIESQLQNLMDIPVFHDDQHGTAIVVLAGIINALYLSEKHKQNIKIVICGAGAAGIASAQLLLEYGINKNNIYMVDRQGVVNKNRTNNYNKWKQEFANPTDENTLEEVIKNADVFIGVSGPNILSADMLLSMNKNPIVFALSNPEPEIDPKLAKDIRKDILLATGRSDHSNQINNVLCFPFIFRGTLDVKANSINTPMKIAAAKAIAKLGRDSKDFGPNSFIPSIFDERLLFQVSYDVAEAAILSNNTAETCVFLNEYKDRLMHMMS